MAGKSKQNIAPTAAQTKAKPGAATASAKPGQKFPLKIKLALLLGIVSLLVYANTLNNGFALDDAHLIKENTLVSNGTSSIPTLLTTPYRYGLAPISNDLYRPLSLVVFAIETQFLDMAPMPAHLINIVVFAGCVVLLFLFLHALLARKRAAVAFIAALLFAVHPVHTEVVANIKSLDELLCFLFAFLALNVFVKYMESGRIAWLVIGFVSFVLSLLAKETVITFVAIVPLIFLFYKNENRQRGVLITGAVVIAAVICLALRFHVLSVYHANNSGDINFIDNALAQQGLALGTRLGTALLILGNYLKLLLIPYPLICDYSFNTIPFVQLYSPLAMLSLVIYVTLVVLAVKRFVKDKKDPYAFAIAFFLITIALFSNLVFLIGTTMGERLLFFPSVGYCISVALLVERFAGGMDNEKAMLKKPKLLVILIPVSLIYGFLAFNRNADWLNNGTLYAADIKKAPDNARLNNFLGSDLLNRSIMDEKDVTVQKQLRTEAIPLFIKAISIYPGYADAMANLANGYYHDGRYDSAAYCARLSLKTAAGNSSALLILAEVYNAQNKFPEAIEALSSLLQINPNNENALMLIGIAYFNSGKYDSSEVYDLLALKLNPKNSFAINTLGGVYLNKKMFPKAIETYRQAMELNPTYASPYANMAVCYFQWQKFDSAIIYAKKTVVLDPGYKSCYQVLAYSYKAMGKTDSESKYEIMMK